MGRKQIRQGALNSSFFRGLFMLCALLCLSFYAKAQVTVTGTIVDEIGEPMTGVIVKLRDASVGTTSDVDGKYSLSVPENSTLEFSYMGYKAQSVAVGSRRVIDITMHEDTQLLDEVVVVGYTTIRKQSLTGALQRLDSEKLTDVTTPNVENMLTGKVPGVNVSTGSGQPGDAGKIVIRGASTLSGATDPLWVVDGVIMGRSGGDINPADIESLTILKDAASTAIYGSQGANGIIQVTTKKGVSGKLKINLSSKFVATTLNKGRFDVMNGAELYDYVASMQNVEEKLGEAKWWTPELRNKNYDWWKDATQTGFAQEHNFSISGGGENITSYFSVGLYDETGAVKGYDFSRYNILAKVDYKPFKWLTIRPMVAAALRKVDNRQHSVGAMYSNLPWDSPYLEDGSLIGTSDDIRKNWIKSTGTNYLYDLQWNKSKSNNHEITTNLDFDVKITDWLTFSSVNSYKYSTRESTDYVDPKSRAGQSVKGRITEISRDYRRLYSNQLLRVNKQFGLHYVSAVLGYEWNEEKMKYTNGQATGFPSGISVESGAINPVLTRSGRSTDAVQSYLSNVNYSYDDKYLAQVSLRRDGASNFGGDNKYGNFFSVSGGWNVHQEDFFNVEEINVLKPRISYGSVGNRPNELYAHLARYTAGSSNSYNGDIGILNIAQMGNPDLRWEKTYTFGVGLDLTLLNRIYVTLDYYNKSTSDLIYEVPLPAVTGKNSILRNEGELRNRGFEVTLGVDIIKSKDLDWRVDANLGLNRNKIMKLYGNTDQIIVGDGTGIAGSAQKLLKPGMDSQTWYLKEWAGVDPKTGDPLWYKNDVEGSRETTSKISEARSTTTGKYSPDFFGGFSTNLRYRDFDLSAVFSYSVGGKIYNYARAEYDSDGAYTDRNQMKMHSGWTRWEKEGDVATHPRAVYGNISRSNGASSRFLETGTYLKMKNLTIGYTVPYKIKGISNIRAYVSGENLFTISHYSGVDPEIPPSYKWEDGKPTGTITGVSTAVYPSTRKFLLGISVTL